MRPETLFYQHSRHRCGKRQPAHLWNGPRRRRLDFVIQNQMAFRRGDDEDDLGPPSRGFGVPSITCPYPWLLPNMHKQNLDKMSVLSATAVINRAVTALHAVEYRATPPPPTSRIWCIQQAATYRRCIKPNGSPKTKKSAWINTRWRSTLAIVKQSCWLLSRVNG
jgi:hypothetical protein